MVFVGTLTISVDQDSRHFRLHFRDSSEPAALSDTDGRLQLGHWKFRAQVSWSLPLTWLHIAGVRGYVQVTSGYGQRLIERNHRTNADGAEVPFNTWRQGPEPEAAVDQTAEQITPLLRSP